MPSEKFGQLRFGSHDAGWPREQDIEIGCPAATKASRALPLEPKVVKSAGDRQGQCGDPAAKRRKAIDQQSGR